MWLYNQEWGIIFHFYILSRFAVRKVFPSESYLFSQFLSVGILCWEKHSMFLKRWYTTKSISNIWQHFSCLLDKGTAKICKKFNSHDGFLRADQEKEKVAARLAGMAVLSCRQLKKPPWDFNFLHIFAIPSSSRHEKRCQMVERLFVVFHHSRNTLWKVVQVWGPRPRICELMYK